MAHHFRSLGEEGVGADRRRPDQGLCRDVVRLSYLVHFNAEILEHLVCSFDMGPLCRHEEEVDEKVSAKNQLGSGICERGSSTSN